VVGSRRSEALKLAEELLSDIELSRLPPTDIARKTSRLARLLDDEVSTIWLRHEIAGYPIQADNTLAPEAWAAATMSNRVALRADGTPGATTTSLGELQANFDAAAIQLEAAGDRPVSISSANPHQFVAAPVGNAAERAAIRNFMGQQKALLDKVVGAFHRYVTERYQELRFGSAVETSFEVVRQDVDAKIGKLVPDALPKLSAAFENAASDNPEQWANAASGCRRLLKAAADALRPPGLPVDGHVMDDDHYINRLIDWIGTRSKSDTLAEVIEADLQDLERRLVAAANAGHKGAHAEVTRFDASRFVTGTYLVLGDILRLQSEEVAAPVETGPAQPAVQPELVEVETPSTTAAARETN
jgi:AbiTii